MAFKSSPSGRSLVIPPGRDYAQRMSDTPVPPAAPRAPAAGFWPSWVTADLVAGRALGLAEPQGAGGLLFWLEKRPWEKGRTVLVSLDEHGAIRDETPETLDIGTAVHEYGGGAYAAGDDGRLVLSDRRESAVWMRDPTGDWREIVPGNTARYADFAIDPSGPGVFAVRERSGADPQAEPQAALVYLAPGEPEQVLIDGADFYAAPRPSPDGERLAWYDWSHPDMPWDATRLSIAPIHRARGITLGKRRILAGHETRCSVIEPAWTPEGALLANSDASGGWRPVLFAPERDWTAALLPDPGGEVGLPPWVFGQRTVTPLADGTLLALVIHEGLTRVRLFSDGAWRDAALGAPSASPVPFGAGFAWLDTPADGPSAIVSAVPGGAVTCHRLAFTLPEGITPAAIARPEPLRFPTADGAEAFALFYAPASQSYQLAEAEKPPLLVMAHGGPTGRASPAFAFKVQWWTSRGFAVLDVNYRGSTGFGRAYREALAGQWGVRDVADCADAVRHVLARGLADPARCVIRGSSAGGLTALESLATSPLFAAGASLYGVTDLRALAEETHKFESRYLDGLIGPWPAAEEVYLARSPLSHAAQITAPVLFLHGDLDRVVPLGQAESMAASLKENGNRVDMHVYAGEGHGFRQRETLMDSFARELAFYQSVFAPT